MAAGNLQRYVIEDFIVYKIKIKTLPNLVNNVYAVVSSEDIILIDAGYGRNSAALINNAVKKISLQHKKKLTRVIITHSHIDHFGAIRKLDGKFKTYAHTPDASVIRDFRRSLRVHERKLKTFLKKSKTPTITAAKVRLMYKMHKVLFKGYPVSPLKEGKLGDLEIILTKGHSPGHVCIGAGKAIFTGDHILPGITPTQSPSYITPGCGLENYFQSLKKIAKLKYKIAFPGHEEPFTNIASRTQEIIDFHKKRLDLIEKACKGKTIYETAKTIFGSRMKGYHTLLALLETAAHLEYLEDKGKIKQNKGIFC